MMISIEMFVSLGTWILLRAEGEGKLVSLLRLRLLSELWVLLAELKPEDEEVLLPSPGLGMAFILWSMLWLCWGPVGGLSPPSTPPRGLLSPAPVLG